MEVLPDMGPTIKANATSHMEAAIAALSGELSKLRTGRASPGTLSISHVPNFHSLFCLNMENFHHILIFLPTCLQCLFMQECWTTLLWKPVV